MSAKKPNKKPDKQPAKEPTYIGLKPRPFRHAVDIALLDLAVAILTGYEIHVMTRGERYAVIGDDNFSVVAVRDGAAKCITCKTPCLCGPVVLQWRRRLRQLGAQP